MANAVLLAHMMRYDERVSMKRSDYSLCCNEQGVWDFYDIKDGIWFRREYGWDGIDEVTNEKVEAEARMRRRLWSVYHEKNSMQRNLYWEGHLSKLILTFLWHPQIIIEYYMYVYCIYIITTMSGLCTEFVHFVQTISLGPNDARISRAFSFTSSMIEWVIIYIIASTCARTHTVPVEPPLSSWFTSSPVVRVPVFSNSNNPLSFWIRWMLTKQPRESRKTTKTNK